MLNKNIKKIYHIADIHIKGDRKDEYLDVFEELEKVIVKDNPENSIIIICGDIFHYKTRYYVDDIKMVLNLFERLTKIAPMIVILGNHDFNPNNKNATDLITPIFDDMKKIAKVLQEAGKIDLYE